MQIRVDNRIQKCPFGYYDAEGLCKKSEEEILETRKAIMMLISEKRLSEKQNPALQKCRNDVALELGDVLFALCCLSNKYKFCLEKPYL
jgi:NTP pyrophosphatase (non-canonical NTP hydrolase)